MLDLSTLTTDRGQRIVLHLEDPSYDRILEQAYTVPELQAELRGAISKSTKLDDGTIHALLNIEGTVTLMTETSFAEWQKDPDWGHRPSMEQMLAELLGASLSGAPTFTGPSLEEANAYAEDPVAFQLTDESAAAKKCATCVIPTGMCPVRKANFDQIAFDKEVSARKAQMAA
jgi:hypothetical protein